MTGEYSLDQGRTDIQQAWVARARLDADRVCQEDEELAHAHCELHRLRTELRDQELREKKQMCEMEEERLRRSLGHLEESDSEVREISWIGILDLSFYRCQLHVSKNLQY